ncbi:unnamed protein product, partial [Medioppia subpectinata]
RKSTINLKGIAIGNGLLDGDSNYQAGFDYLLGHGLVTTDWYEKKLEACCQCTAGTQHECNFTKAPNKTKCESVPDTYVSTPNLYNIYDECYPDLDLQHAFNTYSKQHFDKMGVKFALNGEYKRNVNKPKCPVNGHTPYLNLPEVRKALHVREDAKHWKGCGGSYDPSGGYTIQTRIAIDLINKYKLEKLVIYNGDFDTRCNFIADERFVDGLGFKKTNRYDPWHVDGVIGGFVANYERGLSFVLFRGAGHMVPQDKPEAALHFFESFLGLKKL